MAKGKYRFNAESLTYEKIEHSTKKIVMIGITYFVGFVTVGFIFMFTWLHFFPSAREHALMDENAELRNQYSILDNRIKNLETLLEDMAERDNNIYRVIFEANPIPAEIRNAGFGGVNRYAELQSKPNMELVIETANRIDILNKKVYIQSLSFDTIISLAKNKKDMLKRIPAIQPLRNNKFSSGFGYRIHPVYKTYRMHTGIDLTAPTGTKIYATGDGIVREAEYSHGYGKMVLIDHGFSFQTVYGHMSKILVRPGQKVSRGDIIGMVGNTGTSTGSHLHYEVRRHGNPVNPINYYLSDLSPKEFDELLQMSKQTNQSFD
ncbi:MAG TPA: M23 family metallopeptidase [Bacteroidales bacterium]|mgnify:FL=1|nr:M23 family metallopeptidase [Bacteroidales bacterium]